MKETLRFDPRRVGQVPAVILHRRPYRESSLLLDIFSSEFGRLRLLAKGAKRSPGRQEQCLHPFLSLRLSWAGRGELPVLTGAEPAEPRIVLAGNALLCGFYLNELLLHLLPLEDPHPQAFRLYLKTLQQLGAEEDPERVLRFFEVTLLEEIGYGLLLDREAEGRDIDPAKTYAYLPDRGPVEAAEGGDEVVRGSTLLALKRRNLEGTGELREVKQLMRRIIGHYLDGRPLKSRDLFRTAGRTASP